MINCLRVALFALLLAPALGAQAQQQPEFPELTGRVVDQAELLDASVEQRLSEKLKAHEEATTEQLVVATVADLQGRSIEEYGYQLGRHWGIGQAEKDNGALLIVAPNSRQVRIEVGYGLEGRLTDAQSSAIINQVITPAFREGDYAGGITRGVEAMIKVLGGDPMASSPTDNAQSEDPRGPASIFFFVMLMIVMALVRSGGGGGRGRGRSGLLAGALLGGALGRGGSGGGSGGGFGGGGFGGGGGGFGGGGASGGW
ncbi:TPM domain-containing protein [Halomonas sp. HP20-15]|uniref:TPM domain-containing protein n=1 Tax=Halomonas sp. HP20-15 TaxID=3085901 RepID=UPI002981EA7F|nr:TPM domain-containing protein [Halomonas sp. HP20-15]MDW5377889.1 TPM domain-containing protein [Halomonas sp. HP20-15]